MLAMALMSTLFCYITIKRDAAYFEEEHSRDAMVLAEALEPVIQEAWKNGGHDELAKRVNTRTVEFSHVSIRYVRFDDHSVPELHPSAPRSMLGTVRSEERLTLSFSDDRGNAKLHTYVPVSVNDTGGLEITRPMAAADDRARDTLVKSLMLLGIAGVFCIGVVIFAGVRMIGRPLNRLMDKVNRIGTGDFEGPVTLSGRTELNDLATAMNEMCEQLKEQRTAIEVETTTRIATENQLRHADRLNTVGCLAAGIAHEMGTPLNVVSGRAGLIAGGRLSDQEVKDSATTIKGEADRITRIIRELLDFARRGNPERELTELSRIASQTVDLLNTLASKQQVELTVECAADQQINADPGQVQQVLTNLIMNAMQATDGPGQVDIKIGDVTTAPPADISTTESEYVRIDVTDSGGGISDENLKRIFEPFFTTKDVGEGTGLGLAISYGIVRDHDGWISVSSEPGKGSCFSVYFPAAH